MKMLRTALRLVAVLFVVYVLGLLIVYFNQETIIFHPTVLDQNHKYQFDTPFEEHFIRARDGKKINVLYFTAPKPKGVILLFHGNSGDLQSCGGDAINYVKRGYCVLMPDYRAYGKSDPDLRQENLLADALTCYDYLHKRGWQSKQVVIYGMSLGTGMATYVAALRPHRMLLLYTPYWSMKRLGQEKYPFIPAFLLKYPLESHKYLKRVNSPVYIFHGTKDGTIPVKHAYDMYALSPKKGKLLILKGGLHNDLAGFEAYQKLLDELLR